MRGIDEGKPVDVIYLDFAKEFDKVPHKRLAKKLQACGIRGQEGTCMDSKLLSLRSYFRYESRLGSHVMNTCWAQTMTL